MSYRSTVKAMQSRVPARKIVEFERGYAVVAKDGSIILPFTGTESRVVRTIQANPGSRPVGAIKHGNGSVTYPE